MLELPSKASLNALSAAMNAVAPTTAVGLSRALEDGQVSISYAYAHGFGELVLPATGVPEAFLPAGEEPGDCDVAALVARRTRATEAFLLDNQTRRVASVRLPGVEPATRVWAGFAVADALTADQVERVARVATDNAAALTQPLSQERYLQRLTRLEQAAALMPALLHVLDVREVMDRVSATAKRALPHDLLFLSLFDEDLSTFTVYARSDRGAELGGVQPNAYPASAIRAWTFAVVNDLSLHPFERDAPSTRAGARSSLRFPIRFGGRVLAGIAFGSFTPHAFTEADVPIGQRLADHVASALSHFQLAQRLANQARVAEELRARTTNIELLDELLAALIDTGDLAGVFERVSAIAQKVLPHDAAALLIHLPDGRRGRVYASRGYPAGLPDVVEIPAAQLQNPDWEHDIVDDVTGIGGAIHQQLTTFGLRSLLRVPIRFDGRLAGALMFAASAVGAFKPADVLIARRIADRLAITLARTREVEAVRRADEAATRAAKLEARVQALTQELDARTGYRRVIGESPSWRQVLKQATQVAATDTTALLLGESGTGKEVVARFIHRASHRSHGPFIALNCAALPEQLLEAELFGYERGAFTGATQSKPGQLEQAAGGTLFLDEVGEMSLPAQAKFLRVLQEREFQRLGGTRVLRTDARIVAATNRDLQKAVANGQFREDLFYRLNVFAMRLPPLRDRKDDILPLTQAFLTEFGRAFANPPAGISREAKQMLLAYHWPGNIRELRNLLERAAILCDGGLITDDHLALPGGPAAPMGAPASSSPAASRAAGPEPAAASSPASGEVTGRDLHSVERALIEQALQNARFNKSQAAKALGLTRHQLYVRMRRHGLGT